jgi:hypothetical protein
MQCVFVIITCIMLNIMLWLMRARSAVRDLQHERSGRVADKARGEAECFIRHETTPRVL